MGTIYIFFYIYTPLENLWNIGHLLENMSDNAEKLIFFFGQMKPFISHNCAFFKIIRTNGPDQKFTIPLNVWPDAVIYTHAGTYKFKWPLRVSFHTCNLFDYNLYMCLNSQ